MEKGKLHTHTHTYKHVQVISNDIQDKQTRTIINDSVWQLLAPVDVALKKMYTCVCIFHKKLWYECVQLCNCCNLLLQVL